MNAALWALVVSSVLLAGPAMAQLGTHYATRLVAMQIAAAQTPMSEGEVRKVDKSAGKLTVKHGPLQNLNMPPMTMVFQVKDPAMLDRVKEGDKIKFIAEQRGGALTITQLEVTR